MGKKHGPAIVAIGGGHGLSAVLRGLKNRTDDLTAIVTVADDGGGSGTLREELGMPPPGDIRNCMEALANVEPVMRELMHYRFTDGSLAGQSFGNLLLAALNGISPTFDEAVERMSQVLAITGRVLPVTSADVQLEAVFENGARVVGESKICDVKKQQDCRIHHVELIPAKPKALPAALEAIREADLLLLGPGSLYTSVIPNLLVDGISDAIEESKALKIYVCNIMTQDGETEGMTASEHLAALLEQYMGAYGDGEEKKSSSRNRRRRGGGAKKEAQLQPDKQPKAKAPQQGGGASKRGGAKQPQAQKGTQPPRQGQKQPQPKPQQQAKPKPAPQQQPQNQAGEGGEKRRRSRPHHRRKKPQSGNEG